MPTPKGSKLSKEHKEKISNALKGKKKPPRSLEHSRRISEAKKGCVPWNKNKKMPEGFGLKVSLRQKGKISPNKGKKYPQMWKENNPNWNNWRRITPNGYIFLYMPEHPFAEKSGYIREHRYMAEIILERLQR